MSGGGTDTKNKRVLWLIAAGALAAVIVYMFLWGKLFAFSPVIIGFSKYEQPHTVVYIQRGAVCTNASLFESVIPLVEQAHELTFKRKPSIFIFRDRKTYVRHSPSLARFCAFSSGRLFISPWALQEAAEGKIPLEIYVRHELSHVLLFQYEGLFSEAYYPKWLLEGVAVYTADQLGTGFYPDKNEVYRLMRQGNFMPPDYFKTRKENAVKLDVPYRQTFMYSEFACIVDYIVARYGRERFLAYIKSPLTRSNYKKAFSRAFGDCFADALTDFMTSVSESR